MKVDEVKRIGDRVFKRISRGQGLRAYLQGETITLAPDQPTMGSFDQWEQISIFQGEYSAAYPWRLDRFKKITGKAPKCFLEVHTCL